jgi:hypothetical protein
MTQLDKVTFFSQFFWLCFFFLGFYFIMLKYFLPKMSRILLLRKKKMSFSHQGMSSLQQENQYIRHSFDTLLSQALITSKTLFFSLFSRTTGWLQDSVSLINQTQYQAVNKSYVQSLGETSLSQNILLYHASKNLPEKLTMKLLLEDLKTLKKKTQESSILLSSVSEEKKHKKK